MKNTIIISLLLFANICLAQEIQFEELNIPHLTSISSDSRSANFLDLNQDGWDDIFISNSAGSGGSAKNFLYINNQDGTFTLRENDPIVNHQARFVSASFADADNDGDQDAYIVTWGSNNKNYFYRNNGDATFTYEANNVSGSETNFSESVAWIDADRDNLLDIYFSNSYINLRNGYYHNEGDGVFKKKTNLNLTNQLLSTRSVDWVDYDNDGDLDLFMTNEGNAKNSLYRNDGVNQFTLVTELAIVNNNRNSAGSSWGDIDNDGDLDLFVANYANFGQKNQLFRNMGEDFEEETQSAISLDISSSFGSTFGDLDNDGDLDLIVCNSYLSSINKNYVYINDGAGNFSKDENSIIANFTAQSYGVALGDMDNDGWLDVLITNNRNGNQANSLFRNTGEGNNWVKFNCKGIVSNSSAVGTIIHLKSNIKGQSITQTRQITSASGTCGQNSYSVHFGLGDADNIEELTVIWPSGQINTYKNLTVNSIHELIEDNTSMAIDINGHSISIYPNPAHEYINIELSDKIEEAHFKIFDLNGSLILNHSLNQKNCSVDISRLLPGTYVYEISTKEGITQDTLIISN